MSNPENDWRRAEPRRTVTCPGCGRELFNLQRPQCLWCGARLSQDDFQNIAASRPAGGPQSGPSAVPPLGSSPSFGTPVGLYGASSGPFGLYRPSVRLDRSFFRSPGGWVVIGILVFPFLEAIYRLWQITHPSHMPPPTH